MRKIIFISLIFLITSCKTANHEYTKAVLQCDGYLECGNKANNIYKQVRKINRDQRNSRYREYNSVNNAQRETDIQLASDGQYSLYDRPQGYQGYYKIGEPYKIMGKKFRPKCDSNYKKKGIASWYGEEFYGKETANGEIYNMYDMTAAHPTLPLPSIVRVTNLKNGRTVKVRVNDRGPFIDKRIIDVSKEAAKKLGFVHDGTTKVKVEFLKEDTEKMLKNFKLK
jgi:rare lipoprotein A (peptidoglycan hydrolase)